MKVSVFTPQNADSWEIPNPPSYCHGMQMIGKGPAKRNDSSWVVLFYFGKDGKQFSALTALYFRMQQVVALDKQRDTLRFSRMLGNGLQRRYGEQGLQVKKQKD